MGTTLSAITNSKLSGKETDDAFDLILKSFQNLNLSKSYSIEKGIKIEDDTEYRYYKDVYDYYPIEFESPSSYSFSLNKNIGIIDTIYRYSLLYRSDFYWFDSFRRNLFNIVQVMGGTEIIFLADNCCDKLSYYLECMAWEDISYEIIKEKMICELGEPQSFRNLLRDDDVDYSSITEFIQDDFQDFK